MEQATEEVKKRTVSHRTGTRYSFEHWEACRMDFITGKGSLNWCCRKHSITYGAAQQRAKKDEWRRQRDEWFREKKLRDSVPLIAAAVNPPQYFGEVPPPQPLSPDYFMFHAQRHHANLDKIADVISENWKMIEGKNGVQLVTLEERTGLIRETRELISLQRQLLGIPNVAPIRRSLNEKSINGQRQRDIDLSQLRRASDADEEKGRETQGQGQQELQVHVNQQSTAEGGEEPPRFSRHAEIRREKSSPPGRGSEIPDDQTRLQDLEVHDHQEKGAAGREDGVLPNQD